MPTSRRCRRPTRRKISPMADLQTRIEQIVADSGANIGVALRHIESGAEVMVNADTPVPLASVVKIPVIAEAFHQIGQGKVALTDRWPLEESVKALGSGVLRDLDAGLNATVNDLLTLMTIISDNTATDMLMLRLGIGSINGYMHSLGLTDIHVARTLNDIFADMLPSNDPNQDPFALAVWEAEHGVKSDGFSYSLGADNNVSTPRAMTRLVEMIFRAEILDRALCDGILDIMLKQHFNDRLPRFLPPGTRVAHKTGTFSGVRNDSGVIYIRENSHVAVTTLATWDDAPYRLKPIEDWQHVIAIDGAMGLIGLAAFEAFA